MAGVPLGFSNSAWRHDSHSPHVLGTSDARVDNALLLLALPPHTPSLLGTSNIVAGTALPLPAVLPPTYPLLRTCNIAAGIPQDKSKGKEAPVIPKCRSMSILRTRFANTRKNKGEDSGPKVVKTVNADESDEGAAVKTKIGACKQDSDSLDEDLDEDQHHDHDGGMHTNPDTHPEEQDSPIMPFESATDHGQRIVTESVMPIADDSSDVGLDFPVTVIGTLLGLPAAQPLAPLNLGTPDMAANTAL